MPPQSGRARVLLTLALLPFAAATVAGLALLWPGSRVFPPPIQFTRPGGGPIEYANATVLAVQEGQCGLSPGGVPPAAPPQTVPAPVPPETGQPEVAPTDVPADPPIDGGGTGEGNPAPALALVADSSQRLCVQASVRIVTGPDAGTTAMVEFTPDRASAGVQTGERVRLARTTDPQTGQPAYDVDDFERGIPLAVLAAAFAVIVVAVARLSGLAALLGLGVAYGVIAWFVLPALLSGHDPVAVGLVGAAAIMFLVLYLAHGLSLRTTTALLGTLGSLAVTGVLAAVSVSRTKITGASSDVTATVQSAASQVSISGLLVCGIVIGSLGVLNDVTVTQASAVWELGASDRTASRRHIYARAMRIGRDHIASTVYTLVLAYAGAALPALLLFSISGRSTYAVVTGDEVGGEIVRSLVGGVGLVLSVPLTTAIGVLVVCSGRSSSPGLRAYDPPDRAFPPTMAPAVDAVNRPEIPEAVNPGPFYRQGGGTGTGAHRRPP